MANTLHKVERLDKKKIIEKMFAGGSRSFSVFPLRVVYLPVEELEADASILNPVAIAICFSFLWVSLDIRITSVFFNFRSSRYSENFFPQTLLSSVFGEDCTEGLDSGFSICSG